MQEAQFAVHWKVGLHFHHSPEITFFWKTAPERRDDLFFSIQVLPPLPRPLPAVDRRNARPVRGRQHDDQDAGFIIFISLLFLKIALLLAGDQRHAQPLPRLPDQDSSKDRRRSHPTPSGELFRLADLNILLYTLTFSSTLILNISLSRVKTAGRYR